MLHARHALQPNSLGYCGPDENGRILEHLHASSVTDDLTSTLTKFEAAYPFVRMIAKSTGMQPFDKQVTEAYWIGNSLLDKVEPTDFFEFAHQGLGKRMKKQEAGAIFRELGGLAKPHHTFYVLGMFARSNIKTANQAKLLDLMDSCRVSWGRVLEVKPKSLIVDRSPLTLQDDKLSLAGATKREVHYDSEIPPFSTVKRGDWVSLHWNFASEKLTKRQLRNLVSYTSLDIQATNRIVAAVKPGTK